MFRFWWVDMYLFYVLPGAGTLATNTIYFMSSFLCRVFEKKIEKTRDLQQVGTKEKTSSRNHKFMRIRWAIVEVFVRMFQLQTFFKTVIFQYDSYCVALRSFCKLEYGLDSNFHVLQKGGDSSSFGSILHKVSSSSLTYYDLNYWHHFVPFSVIRSIFKSVESLKVHSENLLKRKLRTISRSMQTWVSGVLFRVSFLWMQCVF